MTNLTNKRKKAGYARQRQVHLRKRDAPSREGYRLGEAIKRTKIELLESETEVTHEGRHLWFNAKVQVGDQVILIDQRTVAEENGNTDQKEMRAIKDAYCAEQGIPCIVVGRIQGLQEMQARIELAIMKIRRHNNE